MQKSWLVMVCDVDRDAEQVSRNKDVRAQTLARVDEGSGTNMTKGQENRRQS